MLMLVFNRTVNSIQLLKEKGIDEGIKSIFPVKFASNHVKKHVRGNSWFLILIGTIYLFIKLLFKKKKRFLIKEKYNVLFYVPNNKYKKFVDALTKNVSFSYLIISEEIYDSYVLSVDDYKLVNAKNYPIHLLAVLFRIMLYSLNTNQLIDFKTNYWNILSLVRRDLIAEALFGNVSFDKYFSFHPVEGFHQVFQSFYKINLKKTYAIRPTTTSLSKEHQFISIDNLFYKTENELRIYQHFNLSSVKLIKGGLIADPKPISIDPNKKGILFLDTCTNIHPKSITIRRKAISQFLNFANRLNENVYYKFHPGLVESEKKRTKKEIDSIKNLKIEIVNTNIPWDKISIVLGFDTTLYYDCFLYKIPIISLRGDYYLSPNQINEFSKSPIITIKNESDFEIISKLLNDNAFRNKKKNEQYFWFSKQYNYPLGMNTIKQILAE